MRELPQRDDGQGQDAYALADNRVMRHMSSHHGLDTGDLQSHRSGPRHLRELPQRDDGQGQDAHALTHDGFVRFVPPHDRLDTGDVQS